MYIQWIMLIFLWKLSSFGSASQHSEGYDLIGYEVDICPSYCDPEGNLVGEQYCFTRKTFCCHEAGLLTCCSNDTLKITDEIQDGYNCKDTIEHWEIILAVCIPLGAISLFAFFAMLSVILVKKRRQRLTTRSRSSSTESCSSCSSSHTSPGRERACFSQHESDTSGTASHSRSHRHSRNVFVVSSSRRRNRRHRNTPLSPTGPPPYLEKPPSYIELFGGHEEETSDTESTHFYEEVPGTEIIHIRSAEYDNHSFMQTQILDASRLMEDDSQTRNVQPDVLRNSNAESQEAMANFSSEHISEYVVINEEERSHSTPHNVEHYSNNSTDHERHGTSVHYQTGGEYQIDLAIHTDDDGDTRTDTSDTSNNIVSNNTPDVYADNQSYCEYQVQMSLEIDTDDEFGNQTDTFDSDDNRGNTRTDIQVHGGEYYTNTLTDTHELCSMRKNQTTQQQTQNENYTQTCDINSDSDLDTELHNIDVESITEISNVENVDVVRQCMGRLVRARKPSMGSCLDLTNVDNISDNRMDEVSYDGS